MFILTERRPVVRINGHSAFASMLGPTTFTARDFVIQSRSIFANDRSGPGVVSPPSPSIPATLKRASTLPCLCAIVDASASMEDWSSTSRGMIRMRFSGCPEAISFSSRAAEGDRQHAMSVPSVRFNRSITNCRPMPRDEPFTTNTASGSALRALADAAPSSVDDSPEGMSGNTAWPRDCGGSGASNDDAFDEEDRGAGTTGFVRTNDRGSCRLAFGRP
mmetsp:Transcript_34215/g.82728  ORF Transcript_34215/g.82728 Transcript_34215/m.82728 type:complete len:219 (-) Transcript_34215:113-769(-)